VDNGHYRTQQAGGSAFFERRMRVPVLVTLGRPGGWPTGRAGREELAEDYRRMIYAESRTLVEQARLRFAKKWRLRCPAVVECLDEAGDDLFTFLRFLRLQWKALRTTNALERINAEFRRRTKTQASLPGQDAVLLLLFGLLRSGQIRLRKIDGWHDMARAAKAA
jgi:putative transposase